MKKKYLHKNNVLHILILFFAFLVTPQLSFAQDADGDGITNTTDLDDDNDGVPDTIESPDCFYTKAELDAMYTLTTDYTGIVYVPANTLKSQLTDGNLNTYIYAAAQAVNNKAVLQLNYGTQSVKLNSITVKSLNSNPFYYLGGATYILQGWNGTAWVNLSVPYLPISDADGFAGGQHIFTNTITPTIAYTQYRIFGTALAGVNNDLSYISEIVPDYGIIESNYPKASCTGFRNDSDSDGTPNYLETDSDNDGCPDAYEARVTGATKTTFSFSPLTVGLNGLSNSVETSSDSGVLNYTSFFDPYAVSGVLNSCADRDGDGIDNIYDIDNDNDGIPDTIEAPSCFYTKNELNASYTLNSDYSLFYVGGPTDIKTSLTDKNTNTYVYTSAQTVAGKTILQLNYPQYVKLSSIAVTSPFAGVNPFYYTGNSTYTLEGWNGSSWITLSTAYTPTSEADGFAGNTHVFSITTPNYYTQYRIQGSGTGFTDLAYMAELVVNYDPTTTYPKAICSEDTNGDGIPNFFDTDSDGDGCSDAYEAHVTGAVKTTFTIPGPYGTNGLANSVEMHVDSGTINYTSTYTDYAINGNLSLCIDSDNDGVPDPIDIDDDNDGVPDSTESPECFYSYVELLKFSSFSSDLSFSVGGLNQLNNSIYENNLDTNPLNGSQFTDNQNITGKSVFDFTIVSKAQLTKLVIPVQNSINFFNFGSTARLEGWDGTDWVDLTGNINPALTATPADNNTVGQIGINSIVFNLTQNQGAYNRYRVLGVSGTVYSFSQIQEVVPVFGNYNSSLNFKGNCSADLDGDGLPNHLDLDSDGDLCNDSFESGATNNPGTPVIGSASNVGANGLADMLETTPDSGAINYTSTYTSFANSVDYNKCLDYDGDGVPDVVDLDDDNDGILDVTENSGCGASTYKVGYLDVILANNDVENVRNILTDLTNFGPSGTIPYTLQFVPLTTPVSQASIEAQGIDMIYVGSSANACGASSPSTICTAGVASASDMNAILTWSKAELDNFVFAVQNEAGYYGYAVDDNNVNSNYLTNSGQFILGSSAPFGASSTYDQAGSVQNTFGGAGLDVLFQDYYGRPSVARSIPYNDIILSDATDINNQIIATGNTNNVNSGTLNIRNLSRIIANSFAYGIKIQTSKDCDFDGDGIVNRFDNNSDGGSGLINYDSCFDAVEGAGSITPSQVDSSGRIIGAVNANGVPLLISGGQGIGTYTDPAQDPDCFLVPFCYKPAATVGTTLNSVYGITALGRAGNDGDGNVTNDWPMIRKGAHIVLEAKTKGFVINRLNDAQIAAIPGANLVEGMIVYNTSQDCLQINTDGTPTGWKCYNTQTCP
ncbi:hypothetical protein [Chryseobacterium lathyri]|uniref:IgGFc-binding protein N-terminal domain-containing protein n=1 Tax=Chryseobacterium lathyri TaxID=395933 RepID=A0A511YFS0_9FLAO|nr:hypothetical protein [Chryseobacterium lathyri]GEN74050.1 hypothetical protein CLA01_41220 [Chryseobacterium lathyri]